MPGGGHITPGGVCLDFNVFEDKAKTKQKEKWWADDTNAVGVVTITFPDGQVKKVDFSNLPKTASIDIDWE